MVQYQNIIMSQSRPLICRYLWFCKISNQKSGVFLQSSKRNYDVSVIGVYTRNMFQWNKNDIKSSQTTDGDYFNEQLKLQIQNMHIVK